ncbi:aminotransferase class III-fold pyridoxal phosphate-dependent enzyme [Alphaproteobacteria bacterium]|nr:aminotransferase class III-fold pyridoxal phosphate-dependent enzyme [Alphaproteobacteria bacterium]
MILNSYFDTQLFKRAKGNYLFDTKNNKYLDTSFGSGTLLFGHNDREINEAIKKQLSKALLINQNHTNAHILDEKLVNFFKGKIKNFVYCNTGSEASQRAIRYAREYNGKDGVIFFKGSWHGMNEWTIDGGGNAFEYARDVTGLPSLVNKIKHQMPMDYKLLKIFIEENYAKISSIIIEPIKGSNPEKPNLQLLDKIIILCKKYNIVTIFDEIISGFRINKTGVSLSLKNMPDIILYGKSLGGGLPIGVVALSEKIAKKTFFKKNSQTLAGGTFSLNPLVCASSIMFLNKISKHNFNEGALSNLFRDKLNNYFKAKNFDLKINGYGSMSRIIFTKDQFESIKERIELENKNSLRKKFIINIKKKKVIWPKNGVIFHSAQYDQKTFNILYNHIVSCIN